MPQSASAADYWRLCSHANKAVPGALGMSDDRVSRNSVKVGGVALQANIALLGRRRFTLVFGGVVGLAGARRRHFYTEGNSVDASRGRTRMNERLVAGSASAQVSEHRSRSSVGRCGHRAYQQQSNLAPILLFWMARMSTDR